MAASKCLLLLALLGAAAIGGSNAARPPKPPLPPVPPLRVINNCPSCTRSLVMLGDSFADGGLPNGLWSLDNSTYPYAEYGNVSAYYQGRFSNGLAWFEIMQAAFNISSAANFAVGGATVNSFPNRTAPSTLASQLEAALAYLSNSSDTLPHPSLGIVSIGASDVIELAQELLIDNNTDVRAYADIIVNATIDAAQQLLQAGVDSIAVVPTFTWLYHTPLVRALRATDPQAAGQYTALVGRLNGRLATAANRLANVTNATVAYIDVAPELNRIVVTPQKYVLKNTTTPCLVFDPVGTGSTGDMGITINGTSFEPATLVSACSRPQDFLFWDIIHPTIIGHRLISKFVAGELRKWRLLAGVTVVA